MADVFISYSRRDKEFVQALHKALVAHDRDTWVDWEDIPLTTDWWMEIQHGIEAANTFVFVISPDSIASTVCNQEVEHAIRYNKRLMPIIHREVDMTKVNPALARHNALYFRHTDDFETALGLLLKALDTDLKHVRAHTRLLVRTLEWEREKRDSSFLLRDRDLEASERWLEQAVNKEPKPTSLQLQYITASQQLRQQQQEFQASYRKAEQDLKQALVYRKVQLRTVLLASIGIAALTFIVRFLGLLQPLELAAYDQFMRLRSSEGKDERFVIVEVTDDDIQRELSERGTSLSDDSLNQLLQKLEQSSPRLIGLDLYRDFKSKQPGLANRLSQNDRLFGLCKVAETDANNQITASGTGRPVEIPPQRVGFSDFVEDDGGVIRRHLLIQEQVAGSKCTSEYAFSLLLAQQYLALEPGEKFRNSTLPAVKDLNDRELQLGHDPLKRFEDFTGGYQFANAHGYQILLNYRSYTDTVQGPFERITLGEVLNNQFSPDMFKDKLVLIGVTSTKSVQDYRPTPFGSGDRQLSGVLIQAHMISQLISSELDGRPLLWVLPQGIEAIWILGWSIVGGLLAWRLQHLRRLGIAIVISIAGLTVVCFVVFTQAGWIPLVPPLLSLLGTSGVLVYAAFRRPYRNPRLATPVQSTHSSATRS